MSIVGSESTHPLVALILVVDQVPFVRLPVEWYQHVSILTPSTLHVALVVGDGMAVAVAAYVPVIGCPTLESELTSITIEQKLSSLVSLFEPYTTAFSEPLPTTTPVENFALIRGDNESGPLFGCIQ